MIDWLAIHKDALVALAVLLMAAMTVIIASTVGAAVFLGVRMRRHSVERQSELLTQAVATLEECFALNRAQNSAAEMRIADQQWAEVFRQSLAELQGLIYERAHIVAIKEIDGEQRRRRLLDLSAQATVLIAKLQLLTGVSDDEAEAFYTHMHHWAEERDPERVASKFRCIVELACTMIDRRLGRLGAIPRPASQCAAARGSGESSTVAAEPMTVS